MGTIYMNRKQYDEIGEFYLSLGLSEKQAKRLQKNVFNYSVKPDEDMPYNERWSFYPQHKSEGFGGLFAGAVSGLRSGGLGRAKNSSVPSDGMARCAAPMMMAMASRAPACAEVEEVCEDACIEDGAAETHAADELPEMDPLADTEVIFSANVNSASWSYVRNTVKRGRAIDPSFVRAEEMINCCDYAIEAPKDKTFAVAAQTAPCPWRSFSSSA